jgi:hypothetical protein
VHEWHAPGHVPLVRPVHELSGLILVSSRMWKFAGGFSSSAAAEMVPVASVEHRPDSPEYSFGHAPHGPRADSPDMFCLDHVPSGRVSAADSTELYEPRGHGVLDTVAHHHPPLATSAPQSLPGTYSASPDTYDYLRMQAMARLKQPYPLARNNKRPHEDVTPAAMTEQYDARRAQLQAMYWEHGAPHFAPPMPTRMPADAPVSVRSLLGAPSHRPATSAPPPPKRPVAMHADDDDDDDEEDGGKDKTFSAEQRRMRKNDRERRRRQEVSDAMDRLASHVERLTGAHRRNKTDKVTVLLASIKAIEALTAGVKSMHAVISHPNNPDQGFLDPVSAEVVQAALTAEL